MSILSEPGDLARTPLAAILLEALNLRATGTLRIEHGGGLSQLHFRGGAPVGAQVFNQFRPLGHILLQRGIIDIDALSKSLALMAQQRRPQGEILVEMGAATQGDVDRALAEQQEGYVAAIADLSSGAYVFDANAELPAWARGAMISPLRTIVDALERPQAQALVASALQMGAGGVRLASGYAALADEFRWSTAEEALLAPLALPTPLETFFSGSAVPPERARAILAALLLLNLAVPAAELPRARGDTAVGLFLDLAFGVDGPAEPKAGPPPPPKPATPGAPAITSFSPAPDLAAHRSDPEVSRARRQRLLQRAMANMGVGPFAHRPSPSNRPGGGAAPGAPAVKATEADEALRRSFLEVCSRAREPDLFARLGVSPEASRDEVRQAYLALAKAFHPDRFGSPALADLHDRVREFFTAVNEAYEVLSDDARRQAYAAERKGLRASPEAEAARVDFQKGEVCAKSREWSRARGFYEAAVRADPKPDYLAALAWTLVVDPSTRNLPRAKTLLEQAMRDPTCARARYVSGLVACETGDLRDAERFFRMALEVDPKYPDALRELRLLAVRRGR